jgi:hypothetical protein
VRRGHGSVGSCMSTVNPRGLGGKGGIQHRLTRLNAVRCGGGDRGADPVESVARWRYYALEILSFH